MQPFFNEQMMKIRLFFLSVILLTLNEFAVSQSNSNEIGATIGVSYYQGDVNHQRLFNEPGLSFGIVYKYIYNPQFSFKAGLYRSSISGTDAGFSSLYQQIRGHAFSNTLYEPSVGFELNFLPYDCIKKRSRTFYITSGLSLLISTVQSNMFSMAVPVGIGYKYRIKKKLTLAFEWNYRITFTDNLDLTEDAYNENFATQHAGKQNYKIFTKDIFSYLGISISYNLSRERHNCPAYGQKK